jgi:hypothetical protein
MLGGEKAHRKWLLMYHDKRFQTDEYFQLVALNHAQIKESSNGGYVLARSSYFNSIADRVLKLDPCTLDEVACRMKYANEKVVARNEDEKRCFDVFRDLDHISKNVTGSLTSKKHRRNEAWALLRYKGAPTWFITFAPADVSHPLSIYYAGNKVPFAPGIESKSRVRNLIANNPVAAARFFDFMVKNFIEHILGVGAEHSGVFGDTSAYYGTVEEQGRLTLHLHLLLWIKGALSPQEIRNRLQDPNSQFHRNLIQYLEACHRGELFDTTCAELKEKMKEKVQVPDDGQDDCDSEFNLFNKVPKSSSDAFDSRNSIPSSPPHLSKSGDMVHTSWFAAFKDGVNRIAVKCNMHDCYARWSTCLVKGKGVCAARMPRSIVEHTAINSDDGSIEMRHREPWMNTINPVLSYLMACNN